MHPWGIPPWKVGFRSCAHALPEGVDFGVVGGGFTGLSAAAWLRKLAPDRSVAVLESSSLGEGASGRTGGLVLADTAAGPLPGLGDVLAGYQEILRALEIDARLELPGVFEIGRSGLAAAGSGLAGKDSPIRWSDSGELKVVREVPGGALDPGRAVGGLARAAEKSGAQIFENTHVEGMEFTSPLHLGVERKIRGRVQRTKIRASQVLLATNALSLELLDLRATAQAKLTLALATAPLSTEQLEAIGLSSRRPFYTVDLPYLWGRLLQSNGVVFGAGLVPTPGSIASLFGDSARNRKRKVDAPNLSRFDVRRGEAAESFQWLETRVHHLHAALRSVRITHRWAGPILFTEGMRPIFRRHPRSKNIMILAGYNGHGVALSVYLGKWAAEALLGQRSLPHWD